jgi:hypothetical protein
MACAGVGGHRHFHTVTIACCGVTIPSPSPFGPTTGEEMGRYSVGELITLLGMDEPRGRSRPMAASALFSQHTQTAHVSTRRIPCPVNRSEHHPASSRASKAPKSIQGIQLRPAHPDSCGSTITPATPPLETGRRNNNAIHTRRVLPCHSKEK